MIRIIALAALLSATIAGAPARAADIASLSCIEDELGTQAATEIRDRVSAKLIAGGAIPDAFDDNELSTPLRTCAARFGWSEQAQLRAGGFAKAHLLLPSVRRGLSARGTDPDAVAAVYRELPPNARHALGDYNDEDARKKASELAVKRMMARKVRLDDARGVGRLMAMLSIMEFTPGDFARL